MSSTQEIRLCVITDLHIGHPCKPGDFRIGELSNLVNEPNVSEALSRLLKDKQVTTLICCGDLIHNPADPHACKDLEKFLCDCTEETDARVCGVLGNHDLWLETNGIGASNPWALWNGFPTRLGNKDFHLPGALPICCNLENRLCDVFLLNNAWDVDHDGTWKKGTEPVGTFSNADLAWLDQKLSGSSAKWSVVVSHFPLHYFVNDMTVDQRWITILRQERKRLHAILEKYPRAVLHLAGHTHESRITHGQGAIEITTPAFNEKPHACRLLTITANTLSVETYVYQHNKFRISPSLMGNPQSLTFQLGQANDVGLSLEGSDCDASQSRSGHRAPAVSASPNDFSHRLFDGDIRRLVREGFEEDRDRLRDCANRTPKNESAWEGYVGHSLQQMNESRKAFVEDINRYALLYSVMLGAIFIFANQAIQQPDRWLAVFEMFMAVGLTLYTMRILGLLRQKARASYSYYVASSFHAFVVHAAFCDSEPHTWMKHARNYLESVRTEDLKNLQDAEEKSPSWIRQLWAFLFGLVERVLAFFLGRPKSFQGESTAGSGEWNHDTIRHNWQRIAEERWTKTSSHKNANNLFHSFDRAAKLSGLILAGLCLIGLAMCGVKGFGVWDWGVKGDNAPPPASIHTPVPTPSVPALHDNGPMRPADDAREEGASAESAAHGAPVPEGSHAEAGG